MLGFLVPALTEAVLFELATLFSPDNPDLRPESAWAQGALWFGFAFGPFAAILGAAVGFWAQWARDETRASKHKE